jgi:Fic-DOC domain mobile mystery protein B
VSTDRWAAGGDPPGATHLEAEELVGLIPTWVARRSDLDRAERDNILSALAWTRRYGRRWTSADVLNRGLLRDLHRRMFGDVWQWAGTWRQRNTNIGVSPHRIVVELEQLLGDVAAQLAHTAWPADEVAVRFHHRLVSIHPFPNGNGRHARLAADVLIGTAGQPWFTWGARQDLSTTCASRDEYLAALRTADRAGDYARLLAFARS